MEIAANSDQHDLQQPGAIQVRRKSNDKILANQLGLGAVGRDSVVPGQVLELLRSISIAVRAGAGWDGSTASSGWVASGYQRP